MGRDCFVSKGMNKRSNFVSHMMMHFVMAIVVMESFWDIDDGLGGGGGAPPPPLLQVLVGINGGGVMIC